MRRKGLSKSISKLVFKRSETKEQRRSHDTFADEMIVNLHMFSTSMKNRVGSQVSGTDIVKKKEWSRWKSNTNFTKKRFKPRNFCSSVGKSLVLRLSALARNNFLFGGLPRDKIRTKEGTIAASTTTIIRAACPISISINSE